VAEHGAGKQARFEKNLEPVADPENGTTVFGKAPHLAHDRREARHRSGPQIVAVREPARQNQHVGAFEIGVLVPEVLGLPAKNICGGVIRVLVAVAAWKDDNPEFHLTSLFPVQRPAFLPSVPPAGWPIPRTLTLNRQLRRGSSR